MEELDPISRIEQFLDAVLNGDPAPFEPYARAEFYLAKLCGSDVALPVPQSRIDYYLAYKCGEDVEIHDPIERIDFYLAKWCGVDCEVPDPIHPVEYYLNALANSGELKTVSGNPISISDALAKPAESLSIEILPYQSGSGDPSPDNVRPISGWTGVNIQHVGKNLLNIDDLISANSGTFPGYGYIFKHMLVLTLKPSTTYTLSSSYDMDGNVLYFNDPLSVNVVKKDAPKTATTDADGIIRIGLFDRAGIEEFESKNATVQLEEGETATAYEHYTGTTYSIDWQDSAGTVYGCTFNPVSGVMTVDRAMWTLDSTIPAGTGGLRNISTVAGFTQVEYYPYRAVGKTGGAIVSDKFAYTNTVTSAYQVLTASGNTRLYFTFPAETNTDAAIRTWFTNNPTQVVYELATPLTYQLTPTQVDMLLGNNVIWNDVGDMILEYLADGPADDIDALQILLGNRYVNLGEPDEATDREALDILLGGNTR